MTTDKNYTINFEDAYAHWVKLSVDFTLDGVNYEAKCNLIGSYDIEDIEVLNLDTNEFVEDAEDEAWVLGDFLLFNMNVNKLLQC
jgi:hypothetical protein